jgi:DNA-binding transcriptional MerR regulator
VSKTTGIPVSTLRIWETRYGAFAPVKTEGKQRLFAEHDVSKALLLKQLSQSGHGIGMIANLDLDQLRHMSNLPHSAPQSLAAPGQAVSLAVVGLTMANRIESKKFAAGLKQNQIKVTDVLIDLAAATKADLAHKPQVLLVNLHKPSCCTTLHPRPWCKP